MKKSIFKTIILISAIALAAAPVFSQTKRKTQSQQTQRQKQTKKTQPAETQSYWDGAPAVLKKKDKARANHYKYYTDQEWGMASNYDLCLNSGLIGIEGCVKAIQQVLELTE